VDILENKDGYLIRAVEHARPVDNGVKPPAEKLNRSRVAALRNRHGKSATIHRR
jgi:hypothetical protein